VLRGRSEEVLPTIPRQSARLVFIDGGFVSNSMPIPRQRPNTIVV